MFPIDIPSLIEALTAQSLGVGLFLSGAGVAFLLMGHRIFRGLVAVSFCGIGYLLGSSMPAPAPTQILLGLVGAAALAGLSIFFPRGAVAALTGGWCGVIAMQFTSQLEVMELVGWALAFTVFAIAISLTFIVYEEVIAFITSLEGALLCVGALIIFFSHSPVMWFHVRDLLVSNPFFGAFLVMTATVTGYFYQLSDIRHKHSGVKV